jgi:hypothetical protein
MAGSNVPSGLYLPQQTKHLHGLTAPSFHDAVLGFKKLLLCGN